MYEISLIGLPNVGKSSIFNFLTKKNVLSANYPFATIKPNIALMDFFDERAQILSNFWKSKKISNSSLKVIDVAGLIKNAHEGSGLGNEFLSNIRETDLICHVLRLFSKEDIIHVEGYVDPIRDFEIIDSELILSDIQQLNKLKILNKKPEYFKEEIREEIFFLEKIKKIVNDGNPIRNFSFDLRENNFLKKYNFLTSKPFILIINCDKKEDFYNNSRIYNFFLGKKVDIVFFFTNLLESHNDQDRNFFLSNFIDKIKNSLNLKIFFTSGEKETKIWIAKKNMNALDCSYLIHSDIGKKFIRAEIYNFDDLNNINLVSGGKKIDNNNNIIKFHKSTYDIKDGDVCFFLFGR